MKAALDRWSGAVFFFQARHSRSTYDSAEMCVAVAQPQACVTPSLADSLLRMSIESIEQFCGTQNALKSEASLRKPATFSGEFEP
jgi:hypothetical protein